MNDHSALTVEEAHKSYAKGCRCASCKTGHKLYMQEYRAAQRARQGSFDVDDSAQTSAPRSTGLPVRSTDESTKVRQGDLRHPGQPRLGKMHRNAKPTERAAAKRQVGVIGEKTVRLLQAFADAKNGLVRNDAVRAAEMRLQSVCSCWNSLEEHGYIRGSGESREAIDTGSPGEIFYITQRGRDELPRARARVARRAERKAKAS